MVDFLKAKGKGMLTAMVDDETVDALLEKYDRATEKFKRSLDSYVETINAPFHKVVVRSLLRKRNK